jgi:hypothetical protein
MAYLIPSFGLLVVPHGDKVVSERFADFLWEKDLAAFLVKNEWVNNLESGQSALGLRIAPGSC